VEEGIRGFVFVMAALVKLLNGISPAKQFSPKTWLINSG
jgi:hypothetical protein